MSFRPSRRRFKALVELVEVAEPVHDHGSAVGEVIGIQ